MKSGKTGKQALELVGMLMIGDGLLSAIQMERHLNLWKGWSRRLDRAMDFFLERAALTRVLGLVELGAGLAMTSVLTESVSETPQPVESMPSPPSSVSVSEESELIQV